MPQSKGMDGGCSATLRGEGEVGKQLGLVYEMKTLVPPLSTPGPCGVEPPNPYPLLPKGPRAATPRGGLPPPPPPPSPSSMGKKEPAPAPAAPGGRSPVPRRRGRQLVPGKAPSAGCVNPIRNSISRLPVAKGSAAPCAGSARGRGDWCTRVHVTDPSLSSCPKMGSSSHEQAAVPHRAADKQKTDSISTK